MWISGSLPYRLRRLHHTPLLLLLRMRSKCCLDLTWMRKLVCQAIRRYGCSRCLESCRSGRWWHVSMSQILRWLLRSCLLLVLVWLRPLKCLRSSLSMRELLRTELWCCRGNIGVFVNESACRAMLYLRCASAKSWRVCVRGRVIVFLRISEGKVGRWLAVRER